MDRFGPTGKLLKKSVHLSKLITFLCLTGPIEWTDSFDHSDPFSIPVPCFWVFSMYNMEENTYQVYGLAVNSSYRRFISRENLEYFRHSKVVFELMHIRSISGTVCSK